MFDKSVAAVKSLVEGTKKIVAAVISGCSAAAFFYGRSTMRNTLVPTRSVSQVNEDIRTVKEQLCGK